MRQRDIEGVIVLHKGGVLVVQDQLLERGIEVVRLCKAIAGHCFVDYAVFCVAVHPAGRKWGHKSLMR